MTVRTHSTSMCQIKGMSNDYMEASNSIYFWMIGPQVRNKNYHAWQATDWPISLHDSAFIVSDHGPELESRKLAKKTWKIKKIQRKFWKNYDKIHAEFVLQGGRDDNSNRWILPQSPNIGKSWKLALSWPTWPHNLKRHRIFPETG